jgi:hypothetical protein
MHSNHKRKCIRDQTCTGTNDCSLCMRILSGPPSTEQQTMYTSLKSGSNVKCDAVAGGAKSTTILYAIHRLPHLRFLGLTYNSTLAHTTNTKVASLGLSNCVYQTFHSTMGRVYNTPEVVRDDSSFEYYLSQIEKSVIVPKLDTENWDCLIVDEAQDIRYPYFRFVLNLFKDVITRGGQLIVLGSHDQVLYDYYRVYPADVRYMHHVEYLLQSYTKRPWVDITLSRSFRLTPSNAAFVNHMLGQQRIVGFNTRVTDNKVDYWVCRETTNATLDQIYHHFIKPNLQVRTCLLFPSIQTAKCRKIVNYFIDSKGVDVKILNQQTPSCRAGVFVSTYHASKGMEFEVVVVFGLQDREAIILSNALNVALTRSCGGRLLVLHDCHSNFQPFSENLITSLHDHVKFRMLAPLQFIPKPSTDTHKYCSLHNVMKFIEPSEIKQLAKMVQIVEGSLNTDTSTGELDVTYIDSLLIRAEYHKHGRCASVLSVLGRSSLPRWALIKLTTLHKKPDKTSSDFDVISALVRANESIHSDLKNLSHEVDPPDSILHLNDLFEFDLVKFNNSQLIIKGDTHVRSHAQAVDNRDCPYVLEVGQHKTVHLILAAIHALTRNAEFGYLYNLSTRKRVKVTSDLSLLECVIQLKFRPITPVMDDDRFKEMCLRPYTCDI